MSSATNGAYFKRLSLAKMLSRTLDVYCKGFWTFTQLAAARVLATSFLWSLAVIVLFGPDFDPPSRQETAEFVAYLEDISGSVYKLLALSFGVGLLNGLVYALSWGAMVRAVADIYLQRAPSLKDCATVGVRCFCPILLAGMVAGTAIWLGFLLFLVPGVYLTVVWFVHQPAIVIEGKMEVGSLGRSYELVSNSWCYVFCTLLIAVLVMFGIDLVWRIILGAFMEGNPFSISGQILLSLSGIVSIPIYSIMITIAYMHLRIEKEGMNAESLAKDLGVQGESTNGSPDGDAAWQPLILDDLGKA